MNYIETACLILSSIVQSVETRRPCLYNITTMDQKVLQANFSLSEEHSPQAFQIHPKIEIFLALVPEVFWPSGQNLPNVVR